MSLEALFSPDGALLATVSADGRVGVWDAGSGALQHEYVHPEHLQVLYTSVAWHGAPPAKRAKRGRLAGRLALGTAAGAVVVWNLKTGEVEQTLQTGRAKPVRAVAFSASGAELFAAVEGAKHVLEFQVASGEVLRKLKGQKHGASRLAVQGRERLVVAATRVAITDLGSGERVRRYDGGHAAPAACLAVAGDVVASSAPDDRFVNVYDGAQPARALAVDGAVRALALSADGADVAALTAAGDVFVFRAGAAADAPAVVRGGQAFAVRFGAGADELELARGSPTQPVFETVSVAAGADVQLEPLAEGGELSAAGGAAGKRRGPTGAVEVLAGGAESLEPATDGAPKKKKKRKVSDGDDGEEEEDDDDDDDDEDMELDVPLAERVDALAAAFDDEAAQAAAAEAEAAARAQAAASVPSATSLGTVLAQALQANDDKLLEDCLASADSAVVDATIARLDAPRVLPLLQKLVDKLERRPGRGGHLSTWILAALTHHTGFLMSVPNLVHALARLYRTIDARLAVFPKLLRLSGRIELVLDQLSKRNGAAQVAAKPQMVFDEGASSSDSDSEGGSGSEELDSEDGL